MNLAGPVEGRADRGGASVIIRDEEK